MSSFKFIFKKEDVNTPVKFQRVQINQGGSYVLVSANTFSNCQNFTIGAFNTFLCHVKPNDRRTKIKELKELCGISKPLLIVDVNSSYITSINSSFEVLSVTRYTSSNYSSMAIIIIDTRY